MSPGEPPSSSEPPLRCSFCGKPHSEVERLIAGPDRVYICDGCIELCVEILADERAVDDPGAHFQAAPEDR